MDKVVVVMRLPHIVCFTKNVALRQRGVTVKKGHMRAEGNLLGIYQVRQSGSAECQ